MNSDRQTPPRAFIFTFGCQMNEYDSDRMARILAERGFESTRDLKRADLIVLNTCSIREKAVQKVMSFLGRLRPLKEDRPSLIIVVTGCVAQQEGEKLLKQAPYLDLVLGTHALHRLPELLDWIMTDRRPVCHTDFEYHLPPPPPLTSGDVRVRAYLTVMQGCDNFCAYCVVPYVRGREISRPPEEILTEARDLVAHGVREIILLGQNVNSYGRGLEPPVTFADLLTRAADLPGLKRIRFTTSHPKDLSPGLISAMAELGPVCEHVHLPVQSGSSRILKAMSRGYTRADYLDRVEALRRACPDVALTTDIIVGFPGETEADFQESLDLVSRVRFDGMFSFKYSDRPITRAARFEPKVDETVKSRRLAELQALQKSITLELNQALIGQRVQVLVEGRGKRYPDQLTSRTRGNKVVNFNGPDELIGCLAYPLIVQAWPNSLVGLLPDAESDPAPRKAGRPSS
ncbi:MAG: tRNA (N6-isopentenyl adenosine(37)-C2)-methylthiotransferase MiaB [Proteobacteria bacterium]|nr:tRNA (N6-isopentenyl adenosine(37)-C2)-methylthiotransferase MiaB [Pseudomonadota bacterium]